MPKKKIGGSLDDLAERSARVRMTYGPSGQFTHIREWSNYLENTKGFIFYNMERKSRLPKRGVDDLAAAYEALRTKRGGDPRALAEWVFTGAGDMPLVPGVVLASAEVAAKTKRFGREAPADLSHRTPPPGKLRVEHVEAAQHERDASDAAARGVVINITAGVAADEELAPDERPRVIAALIRAARKAGYALVTASALTSSASSAEASSRSRPASRPINEIRNISHHKRSKSRKISRQKVA